MDSINPKELALPPTTTPSPPSHKPPRPQPGQLFLKGPIPWPWLQRAGRLPGCALHVGLVIWLEAGMKKSRRVRVCLAHGAKLGAGKRATRRGLRALEKAGLVSVVHRPGSCANVELLDIVEDDDNVTGGPPRGAQTFVATSGVEELALRSE